MKFTRRLSSALAVTAAVSLIAASCGSDDDSSSDTVADTEATEVTTDDTSAPSDTAAEPVGTDDAGGDDTGDTGGDDAAGAGAADDSLEPVRFGYVNQEIGAPAFPEGSAAVEAAVDYANAELGGIDGRPLEVVVCQVDAQEQTNQSCGQEFANDDSILFVAGGLVFNGGPLYSALEGAGIPYVGMVPVTGADQNAENAVFWSAGSLVAIGMGALATNVADDPTTIGVLYSDDAAGNTAGVLVEEGVGDGVETVGVGVDQAAGDVLGPINTLGDVDAYVVLVSAVCVQVAQTLESVAPDVPVVTTASCLDPRVLSEVGDAMDGWYTATPSKLTNVAAGVDEDVDSFDEIFPNYGDEELLAARYTGGNWGMMLTIESILDELGADGLDRDTVTQALTDFPGPVNFGPENVACPGARFASVCAEEVLGYQQQGDIAVPLDGDFRLISVG